MVDFKANLKFSTKKHNNLTKRFNELGGNFSILESKIHALEEKLSCIDPHLALKTTSNAPKKSSNKPKKLRKTPILGYYSVLASDLPSSETDDGEEQDERSKLAPNIPNPASDNTLTNP